MNAPICFVDVETTGLHPQLHRPWEIAIIRRGTHGPDTEAVIYISDIDLANADPFALNVGRYYDRHPRPRGGQRDKGTAYVTEATAADRIERLTRDAILVGVNPAFDAGMLDRLLRRHGHTPAWNHHLIDVPALAIGYLHGVRAASDPLRNAVAPDVLTPPCKSDDLSLACGVDPAEYNRHTALGDAAWTRDWHDTILGIEAP